MELVGSRNRKARGVSGQIRV